MAGRVEPFRLSVIPNSRKAKKQIAVRRIKVVLLFEFDISHYLDENRVWRTKPCSTIHYYGRRLFTRIAGGYVEDDGSGKNGSSCHVLIGDANAH